VKLPEWLVVIFLTLQGVFEESGEHFPNSAGKSAAHLAVAGLTLGQETETSTDSDSDADNKETNKI
jgi:hypothetical protein